MRKIYFKIIILMFVLLFAFGTFKNNLKASCEVNSVNRIKDVTKDLVLLQGDDYTNYLKYDGFEIVENNINYASMGTYSVIYRSLYNNQKYEKKVDVINKTTLEKVGYNKTVDKKLFKDSNENEVYIDHAENGGLTYLLAGFYNPLADESRMALYVFNDDLLIKEKQVSNNDRTIFRTILIANDSIYLIGKTINQKFDVYIVRLNFDLDIIDEKIIVGNEADDVVNAIFLNNNIYISGKTLSNSNNYKGVRKDLDTFIIKVDSETLNFIDIHIFSNEKVDTISRIYEFDECIVFTNSYLKNGELNHTLYKMDEYLEIITSSDYGPKYYFELNDITNDGKYLYILYATYDYRLSKNILIYQKCTRDLKVVKSIYLTLDDYNILNGLITINNDNVLSIIINAKNRFNNNGYIVYRYIEDKLVSQTTNFIFGEYIYNYKNYNANILYCVKNNKLVILKNNNVYIEKFGPADLNKESINDYKVIINNQIINYSNKSKLIYDENKFGQYRLLYYFLTDEVDLAYYHDVFVNDDINVSEGEIYDVNYLLKFNGEANLNGKKIENNHRLDSAGKYILTVSGNDNKKIQVNFEIKKLSKSNLFQDKRINITNVTSNELKNDFDDIVVDKDYDKKTITYDPSSAIYLVPAITLMMSLVMILKNR